MHFEKLDLNDNAQREFFERVYNDAFPARERRPLKYLYRNYTEKDKPFTLWLIWDDGRMVGLVGAWEFPGLVYGEYFAVDQTRRGQGLGQRALALWLSHLPAPALIEVEPPVDPLTGLDDPVARRRIDFYARNGMRLWDEIDYIQPTYHYNGVLVPMRLMTHGPIDLAAQWERLRVPFFREVYGVSEEQIAEATGMLRC